MTSHHGKPAQQTSPSFKETVPSEQYKRLGEDSAVPFRSSRFFCVGTRWYFTTREGFDSGPYATRDRANIGLKRFLHVVKLLPDEEALH